MAPKVQLNTAGLTPYAAKLPMPKKTGNYLTDSAAMGSHTMLQQMITACQLDGSHVLPLFTELQKRQEQMQIQRLRNLQLEKHTPFGKIDIEFVLDLIVRNSDLTIEELVSAQSKDDMAVRQISVAATQLPLTLQNPETFKNRELAHVVLDAQIQLHGNRIKSYKKDGVLNTTTSVMNWGKSFTYQFIFKPSEEYASSVVHFNGDRVDLPENVRIKKGNTVHNAWSDWLAACEMPPLEPLLLHLFFKAQKNGPYKYPKYSGNCKEWRALVNAAEEQLNKNQAGKGTSGSSKDVKDKLEAEQSKKRSAKMAQARAKAATVIAEKRARRSSCIEVKEENAVLPEI